MSCRLARAWATASDARRTFEVDLDDAAGLATRSVLSDGSMVPASSRVVQ